MEQNMQNTTAQCLLEMIKKQNAAYRSGSPIVTDAVYDAEIEKLKELDPDNEWFKQVEPSNVSNSRKKKLPLPMKSLDKVKNIIDLKKWFNSLGLHADTELVLMPKFDGLSLLHNEKTGEAWSRGGSENEGQDCSSHCVAASITSNTDYLYTYGEFVISRKDWEKYFNGKRSPYTGELYKSPRNTAAGFLNRDEPCKEIANASFFRYGTDQTSLKSFKTFDEFIDKICNDFQQESLFKLVKSEDITEQMLMSLFKEWTKLYPIDGIVIYINDLHLWDSIGRHQTSGNPLYAIAYKHPDFTDSFETTVKGITWRASKSGALKPVVEIEAVNTGDCIMENPTGYNAGWINDMDIAPGAKILVTRSGGVIPKILETLEPASKEASEELWDSLSVCPHCESTTSWNSTYKELLCTNKNCSGIKIAKIIFFFKICGVEEMGEEMFAKLYDAGFDSINKIINMTSKDVMDIDGFAEGTANIIIGNMNKIKNGVDLPVLMQASDCFTGIGAIKARKLIGTLPDTEKLNLYNANFLYDDDLIKEKIKSSKLETDKSFWAGFNNFHKFIIENELTINEPETISVDENGKCSGMAVCFSGVRDSELEEKIVKSGGLIVSGVSKKTTHLVVKDVGGTSSKITKAKSLGTTIMSIEEFKGQYS